MAALFTFSVTPAGAPARSASWSIPDEALVAMIGCYAATYFPAGVPVPADADAGTPASVRAPTPEEVLAAIGVGLKDGILANVNAWERATAATAAAAAVQPINAVPQQ